MIVYFWSSSYDIKFDGELLPCPMCGGSPTIEAVEEVMDSVGVIVECRQCGTRTKSVDEGGYEEDALIAIELWQSRLTKL